MPQKRLFGSAAVLTSGVLAGIIESSSGNASVTPMPRRKVRRGRCFFVMNDIIRSPRGLKIALYDFTFIWNGALFTTPRIRSEKRYRFFAASRITARTVGMSEY